MQAAISSLKVGKEDKLIVSFTGSNLVSTGVDEIVDGVVDIKVVKNDLEGYKGRIKEVIFSGGEPTLQKQALVLLAKYAKELKLKTHLKTNGTRPRVIQELLKDRIIDKISILLCSPLEEKTFERLAKNEVFFVDANQEIRNIKESLRIIKNSLFVFETPIPLKRGFQKEDVYLIAKEIAPYKVPWILRIKQGVNGQHFQLKEWLTHVLEEVHKEYPFLNIEVVED